MPQFLYRVRPTRKDMLSSGPTAQEAAAIAEHLSYLQRHEQEGALILAGRTLNNDERVFGIVIFLAPDESAARVFMENDPAVQAGVMTAELFPYKVAVFSSKATL